jgi:hypothetical protein
MKSHTLEEFQFKHLMDSILACLEIQRRALTGGRIQQADAINDTMTKEKRVVGAGGCDSSVTYSKSS